MGRFSRILIALTVAATTLFISTGTLLAASVVVDGVVTVRIDSDDPDTPDIYLPIPARFVNTGLGIARIAMPADARAEMREEMAEVRPLIEATFAELAAIPDSTLVHVESDRETVRVDKRGRAFHVEVLDGEGTHIQVTLPVSTLDEVARFLGN